MSVSLNKHSINASIVERYACICYEFEFENRNSGESIASDELKFVITIDADAFISGFEANIDGEIFVGETKEKKEAKNEYLEAKEKNENAILISQPFKDIPNLFQIKTNIDSKSTIILNIKIEQYLKKMLNFNQLNIEIIDKEFSKYNITQKCKYIDIDIDIYDKNGIFDIQLPSHIDMHKNTIININKMHQTIHCKLPTTSCLNEFILKYNNNNNNESVVLYNKESKTFVHILNVCGLGYIPRRVVFIIDKSASMNGNKWIKTISATITTLKQLRVNTDRYCLIFFNSNIETLHKQLIFADTNNISQCIHYCNNQQAEGCTNINDALMKGIELIESDENVCNNDLFLNQIIFITDGEPNNGERNTNKIISNVLSKNNQLRNKICIFCFGVGSDHNDSSWINDLNHSFLKSLAINTNAMYKRIKESQCDIQLKEYFNILSKPIGKDINITYDMDGINDIDLTQSSFNTLYDGNDLIICGKIKHHKTVNIKMIANISAITAIHKKEMKINHKICIDLTDIQSTHNIQRIWAYLKLKQFAQKRLINHDIIEFDDDDDKIPLSLALRYKFVTPWTSMIVVKHKKEINDTVPDPNATHSFHINQSQSTQVQSSTRKSHLMQGGKQLNQQNGVMLAGMDLSDTNEISIRRYVKETDPAQNFYRRKKEEIENRDMALTEFGKLCGIEVDEIAMTLQKVPDLSKVWVRLVKRGRTKVTNQTEIYKLLYSCTVMALRKKNPRAKKPPVDQVRRLTPLLCNKLPRKNGKATLEKQLFEKEFHTLLYKIHDELVQMDNFLENEVEEMKEIQFDAINRANWTPESLEWEKKLESVANAVNKTNISTRNKIWEKFDRRNVEKLDCDKSLPRLIWSFIALYIKTKNRDARPPKFTLLTPLLQSVCNDIKKMNKGNHYITKHDFETHIAVYLKKIANERKIKIQTPKKK